jgi:predicted PurR-regulated permease PerM
VADSDGAPDTGAISGAGGPPTAAALREGGRLRSGPVLIIAAAAAIYIARAAANVLVPVFISILLSYALEPFVLALTRWHVPRIVAGAVVGALAALLAVSVVRTAAADAMAFAAELPTTIASVESSHRTPDAVSLGVLQRIRHAVAAFAPAPQSARRNGDVQRVVLVNPRFDIRAYLVNAGRGAPAAGAGIVAVVVLTFLLLATGDLYKRKLVRLAGPRWEQRHMTLDVIRAIDNQIERYLLVRLLISAIVAAATGLPLWWLGLRHPLAWALVAGALNVVPIAGPSVAVALIGLAAFLQFRSVEMGAAAASIATAVAAIEGNFLTPLLAGRAGEINTVAVFAGVLFWGWLWGIWGLLLSVPLMVGLKAAAERIRAMEPVAAFLGR